ncbi:MAG TPA: hypothetical protein PKA85_00315 [Ferruginibacter sp.]|nr:hypothetical protein [Ferruginibacter sp.]
MKKNFKLFLAAAIFGSVALTSCSKDNEESNDEELITTVALSFTPVGGGTTNTFQFRDVDGPGGNPPVIDEIVLSPGMAYNMSVRGLNESVTPTEDITIEINNESTSHRFYHLPSAASGIVVDNLNTDGNGITLGVTGRVTTGVASTGTYRVVLRHYGATPPDKVEADPVDSPKSSSDIDITFSARVE